MKEFTEKHHAFIVGSFYAVLTERFPRRGEEAFVHATRRYAEQRGARMAQRAIRDGRALDFATYMEYGEWVSSRTMRDEGGENKVDIISCAPDFEERITQCPWAAQFKEMGLTRCGVVYCAHIDRSVSRGFNPDLVYEVPQTMHEHGSCVQILRGANFPEGTAFKKHAECVRGFDYHCGHVFKTFACVAAAIFGDEGRAGADEVLARFAAAYGQDMADVVAGFAGTDFDVI